MLGACQVGSCGVLAAGAGGARRGNPRAVGGSSPAPFPACSPGRAGRPGVAARTADGPGGGHLGGQPPRTRPPRPRLAPHGIGSRDGTSSGGGRCGCGPVLRGRSRPGTRGRDRPGLPRRQATGAAWNRPCGGRTHRGRPGWVPGTAGGRRGGAVSSAALTRWCPRGRGPSVLRPGRPGRTRRACRAGGSGRATARPGTSSSAATAGAAAAGSGGTGSGAWGRRAATTGAGAADPAHGLADQVGAGDAGDHRAAPAADA
jgi:hypothetical protein